MQFLAGTEDKEEEPVHSSETKVGTRYLLGCLLGLREGPLLVHLTSKQTKRTDFIIKQNNL